MAIKIRISFTFLSKKKEHIEKIIEAVSYAYEKQENGISGLASFFDFFGYSTVLTADIDIFDNKIIIHKDNNVFYLYTDDVYTDSYISNISRHVLELIEQIKKYFKKELEIYFFLNADEVPEFYCNDKEGLFYPERYYSNSVVNGDEFWPSKYHSDFFCDLKELFDLVDEENKIMTNNVKDIIHLKKAITNDNLKKTIEIITNLLYKKYPEKEHIFYITKVELV